MATDPDSASRSGDADSTGPTRPPRSRSARTERALTRLRAAAQLERDGEGAPATRAAGESEGADDPVHDLVHLWFEDALARPLRDLVDPTLATHVLTRALREGAEAPGFPAWVEAQLEAARASADELRGAVGEHLPVTLLGPLEALVSVEVTPDPRLVLALVDHPSLRALSAELLRRTILDFGRDLVSSFADGGERSEPGGRAGRGFGGRGLAAGLASGLASGLAGAAKQVASAVAGDVEARLEEKVQAFVRDALGRTIESSIRHICAREQAAAIAAYRVEILHATLAQPVPAFVREASAIPTADVARHLTALLRALAAHRPFVESVEEQLTALLEQAGERSVRDFLAGSGLEDAWRPALETLATERARGFVATDAFADWLDDLIGDD